MKNIDQWLTEYGVSHQHKTNKLIHWICVPSIVFSLIGMLWSIPAAYMQGFSSSPYAVFVNWASIFIFAALLFYLRLSFMMFLGMAIISTLVLYGNYKLAALNLAPLWLISLIIFTVAWIGQFIGHKIEGKKPSFFQDLQFLLIGPAWLLGFIYRKAGIKYS